MTDDQNRFDQDLVELQKQVEEYDTDDQTANRRIADITQDVQSYIDQDYQDPEIRNLRERLLAAEVDLVERHPRLAAALRSFVAIVDNAGI